MIKKNQEPAYAPLSDFETEEVEWLWPYFLGARTMTIMDGDPGVGKSYLAMHIAAQFSIGGSLPDMPKLKKRRVIYLTTEDDPSFTIRPRIEAMGGDCSMIHVQTRYSPFDDEGRKELREAVKSHPPGLIIIDPLYSFVGGEVDIYKSNSIREVLGEICDIADYSGAAVLCIRHLRKMKAGKAIYQGAGAIDVIGVARIGMLIAEHPENKELKVLAHSKHNLSKRMRSLTYRLVEQGDNRQPRFEWSGPCDLTADDLNNGAAGSGSTRDEAKSYLQRVLGDGPCSAKVVAASAEKAGIPERTLDRAKSDLGVKSKKVKGVWHWLLPDT